MRRSPFIIAAVLGLILLGSSTFAFSTLDVKDKTPKENPCDKTVVPNDIYVEFRSALDKFLSGGALAGIDKQIKDETGTKKTVPVEVYVDDLDGFKKQYKDDRDGLKKDKTPKELEEDAEHIYNSHPAYTYTTDKKVNGVQVIKVKFFCAKDLRLRTIDNNEASGWKLFEQMLHEFIHVKLYSYDVVGAKPPFDDHDDNPENDADEEFFKRFKKYFDTYKSMFAKAANMPEDDVVIAQEEKITFADLGAKEPRLLPSSSFYFLKEWGRSIRRAFTFNAIKKVELELNIVNEKAAEAIKTQETNPNDAEALAAALENYAGAGGRLQARIDKLKETSENPNVEKLLERINERTLKHANLFNQLTVLNPQSARDNHLQGAVDVVQKKIQDIVVTAAEKDKNREQKAADQIARAEAAIGKLESEADAAGGSLANAKTHLALAKTAFAEGKFGEAFGHARAAEALARRGLGKSQGLDAPEKEFTTGEPARLKADLFFDQTSQPAPTSKPEPAREAKCPIQCVRYDPVCGADGKTYGCGEADAACHGTVSAYTGECRPTSAIKPQPIEPSPREGCFCIEIFEPVCGADAKTYSNACKAKCAGIAVAHEGECRIDTAPPPPPNPVISPEPSATKSSPDIVEPAIQEFKLEADDRGFYPMSILEVKTGATVKIHFFVRSSNVYYGGLDFRSPAFKTKQIVPGGSVTVEFVADQSFDFSSYWPLSNVLKATGKVVVR